MALHGDGRRILIIVENLPVPFDRRVWQEASTLREAGYGVSIICPTGKDFPSFYECLDGVNIYRHPQLIEGKGALSYALEYSSALLFQLGLAFWIWMRHGVDVIHACNPPDNIFLVALPFKIMGKRFIFDHHDINPELYEAKFGKRDFKYRLICLFERMTFRAADVSIATNQSYRTVAIERGGMLDDRVFVVRSGPNLERVKRLPSDKKLKKGRKYLVGYVGVMGEQEGIDLLLEVVSYIVHKMMRTDIQFGLVGSGTSLSEMKIYAQQLGVAEYVTFTGRVPDEEMFTLLSTADVCVNPDVVNEMNDKSTMNKIMEYMALSKPIVQFDLVEGRRSAGEASLYALANDAKDFALKIVELLDDPDRRELMGRFGRERVETRLAWEHEAPNLIAAYRRAFAD